MKHCDILNLEWLTGSRDTNIVEPVLVSLEERYGYCVIRSGIMYGLFKLLRYRPKCLLIANDVGAYDNVQWFHFANMLGIRTIALDSEGLYFAIEDERERESFVRSLYWGNNTDQEKFLDLKLVWSEEVRKQTQKYVSGTADMNIKVSGGTGFDRYHFLHYLTKEEFTEQFAPGYEKVILIIGEAFDDMCSQNETIEDASIRKEREWLYGQRFLLRDIYASLIDNNPDILFILKYHPASKNFEDSEFASLHQRFVNTVEYHRDIDISNLVSAADLVVGFDSTVCMEAWLIGKTTILVNPLGTEFRRTLLYKGSVIVKDAPELDRYCREFYCEGEVMAFTQKQKEREECIRQTIQHGDGANYLRASRFIDEELRLNRQKKPKLRRGEILKELIRESAQRIVEKTVFGCVKRDVKLRLQKKNAMHNDSEREASRIQFQKGILEFEGTHDKLVKSIVGG